LTDSSKRQDTRQDAEICECGHQRRDHHDNPSNERYGRSCVAPCACLAFKAESDQERAWRWAVDVLGIDACTSIEERTLRFVEEAVELAQATGLSSGAAKRLIDYVYARPVGEPAQEVGGIMVTLWVLSRALGIDVKTAALSELERCETAEVRKKVRRRQKEKREAGVADPEFCRDCGHPRTVHRLDELTGRRECWWSRMSFGSDRCSCELFVPPATESDAVLPGQARAATDWSDPEESVLIRHVLYTNDVIRIMSSLISGLLTVARPERVKAALERMLENWAERVEQTRNSYEQLARRNDEPSGWEDPPEHPRG